MPGVGSPVGGNVVDVAAVVVDAGAAVVDVGAAAVVVGAGTVVVAESVDGCVVADTVVEVADGSGSVTACADVVDAAVVSSDSIDDELEQPVATATARTVGISNRVTPPPDHTSSCADQGISTV
jgi:hypothetical protein